MERFLGQSKPEKGVLAKIVPIFDLKILKYCFRNAKINFICYMISVRQTVSVLESNISIQVGIFISLA